MGGLRKKFTEHLQKQWVCTIHTIQYGDVPEHILFKTFFLTDRTSNVYRCCTFLSSIVVIHVGGTRDHHLYIESYSCIMTLPSRKPFKEARTYTNTHICVYIYMYMRMYICISYTCIYIYVYMHGTYTYVNVQIHMYMYICTFTYVYLHMYIYMTYVYIYIYIYTQIRIRISIRIGVCMYVC